MPDLDDAPSFTTLTALLTELTAETRDLRVATEAVVPSVEREVRRGRYTRIAVALLGVLSIGLGVVAVVAIQAASRAEGIAQRSLCPVFALLIGGYNPESRPEGDARDAYNTQFRLFSSAYAELECRNGIVPPPIRN